MLLPQGTLKHKNLNTAFTRFAELLADLAENRFSGYVKLNFWGYEGVLVLDTGHIIEAYSSEQGVYLTGEEAVLKIAEKATEADGSLEVFDLASEVALALGYAIQSSIAKDKGSLSNYSLAQVFDYLEREAVTGYVDLQFSGKRGFGTVYYLEGTPVEAVIMSNSGKVACGDAVFTKFLEIGELIQPEVTVHRTEKPRAIFEDDAFIIPWKHQNYLMFWQEFLHYMSSLMSDRLRKNKFADAFEKTCQEISDPFPFLHPVDGQVHFSDGKFRVDRILRQDTFVRGVATVLNRMLQRASGRKLRKLDLERICRDINSMALKYEVRSRQMNAQELVKQIFRGLV